MKPNIKKETKDERNSYFIKEYSEISIDPFKEGATSRAKIFVQLNEISPKLKQSTDPDEPSLDIIPKSNDNFLEINSIDKVKDIIDNSKDSQKKEIVNKEDYIINLRDSGQSNSIYSLKRENYIKNYPNSGLSYIWRHHFFEILYIINKFILILKERTIHQRFSMVNQKQIDIIGDHVFYNKPKNYESEEIIKNLKIIQENIMVRPRTRRLRTLNKRAIKLYIMKLLDNLKYMIKSFIIWLVNCCSKILDLIRPNLKTRIFWDLTLILILTTQMWFIPLFSSFKVKLTFSNIYFQTFPIIIFSVDILFNFITGYYSKGFWVQDKRRIAKHYLKKEFWIDIFTLIPLFLAYFVIEFKQLSLIFMLRVIRIRKMYRKIEDHFQLQVNYSSLISLLSLAVLLLFFVHIFACLWHLQAELQIFFDREVWTWLHERKINNSPWEIKYINSFYYTLVTSVTVGYGEIVPQNELERLVACIIILFGCGQFAYSINSIGAIFQDMFKEETILKQQIAAINDYMGKKNVDSALRIKVRRYLEYISIQEKNGYQKGEAILNNLSKSLKEEVLKNVYGDIIKNQIQFFTNNFSENVLENIMIKVKEITYAPEEIIFKQNQEDEKNFYFISKGSIDIYSDVNKQNEKGVIFRKLSVGESFGELSFILGTNREFSARTNECTRLLYIKREDFYEILHNYPDDLEKFHMIKDSLKLYKNYNLANLYCYSCDNPSHLCNDCPFIKYLPDKDAIIRRFVRNVNERKKLIKERKILRLNSLSNHKIIRDNIDKIIKKIKMEESDIDNEIYSEENKIIETILDNKIASLQESKEEIEPIKNEKSNYIHPNQSILIKEDRYEGVKSFKFYFPNDNIEIVLVKINKFQKKYRKKTGKLRQLKFPFKKSPFLKFSKKSTTIQMKSRKTQILENLKKFWKGFNIENLKNAFFHKKEDKK